MIVFTDRKVGFFLLILLSKCDRLAIGEFSGGKMTLKKKFFLGFIQVLMIVLASFFLGIILGNQNNTSISGEFKKKEMFDLSVYDELEYMEFVFAEKKNSN